MKKTFFVCFVIAIITPRLSHSTPSKWTWKERTALENRLKEASIYTSDKNQVSQMMQDIAKHYQTPSWPPHDSILRHIIQDGAPTLKKICLNPGQHLSTLKIKNLLFLTWHEASLTPVESRLLMRLIKKIFTSHSLSGQQNSFLNNISLLEKIVIMLPVEEQEKKEFLRAFAYLKTMPEKENNEDLPCFNDKIKNENCFPLLPSLEKNLPVQRIKQNLRNFLETQPIYAACKRPDIDLIHDIAQNYNNPEWPNADGLSLETILSQAALLKDICLNPREHISTQRLQNIVFLLHHNIAFSNQEIRIFISHLRRIFQAPQSKAHTSVVKNLHNILEEAVDLLPASQKKMTISALEEVTQELDLILPLEAYDLENTSTHSHVASSKYSSSVPFMTSELMEIEEEQENLTVLTKDQEKTAFFHENLKGLKHFLTKKNQPTAEGDIQDLTFPPTKFEYSNFFTEDLLRGEFPFSLDSPTDDSLFEEEDDTIQSLSAEDNENPETFFSHPTPCEHSPSFFKKPWSFDLCSNSNTFSEPYEDQERNCFSFMEIEEEQPSHSIYDVLELE